MKEPLPGASPENRNDLDPRLLRELVRYYRHSAVGRRVTGIVHNFNTPLQVLSFQAELLERKLAEEGAKLAPQLPPEVLSQWESYAEYRRQKVEQLREEIARLHDLVRLILHQGLHEDRQDCQNIDLNRLVEDELELLQADRFFKHLVTKRLELCANLPTISGHYIDFSQSFRNLVENALEAMQETPAPVLALTTAWEAGRRLIHIVDNGPGIPEAVRPHLFQPFITTKSVPESPRAGLGLFLTRELLAPYQGSITLESEPGRTCATIILP